MSNFLKLKFKSLRQFKLQRMDEFRIECEFGERTQAFKDGTKFYVDYDDFINHVMGNSFRLSTGNGYVRYSSRKDGLHHKPLHRVIMDCPDDMVVDHIDHNPLNNMRSNLRIATQHQNMINQSKRKDNKSGVIGVAFRKDNNRWQARLTLNNKQINLGNFNDFEEACKARKEAEIKYFGEYRNKDNE